jgi:hypothetical protein
LGAMHGPNHAANNAMHGVIPKPLRTFTMQ